MVLAFLASLVLPLVVFALAASIIGAVYYGIKYNRDKKKEKSDQ
ncbi:hypothetical protein [Candidatus Nitrosocosmicus hydrocola]|nr:hypothetical protein [Candidatus Nitrosocosmicus hydrocola]